VSGEGQDDAGEGVARQVDAVGEAADQEQHGHDGERDDDRDERAAGDQHPGGHGRRAAPLEDPRLALRGDRDDEVDERARDHPERGEAGHVVRRGLHVLRADPVVPEDAHEDDEEDDRQGDREEARLPVAQEGEQVEARLVGDEPDHARSSVSSR
jgi:hypothetical protein